MTSETRRQWSPGFLKVRKLSGSQAALPENVLRIPNRVPRFLPPRGSNRIGNSCAVQATLVG